MSIELSYLVRINLLVNLFDSHLPRAHVAAGEVELFHATQGQLSQVPMVDTRGYQGHRNIALLSKVNINISLVL